MDAWYVLDESGASPKPAGPFSLEAVRAMVASGEVRPTTRVAPAGGANWIEAANEPAINDLFRAAPPRVGDAAAPAAPPRVGSPFAQAMPSPLHGANAYSFGNAFSLAFATFKRQWPMLLAAALLGMAIMALSAAPQVIIQMIVSAGLSGQRPSGGALGLLFGSMCLGMFLQVLVGMPMMFGMIYAGAQATRGQLQIGDIFMGFRRFGRSVLGGLLLMLAYIGCAIVAYIPMIVIAMIAGVSAGAMGRGGGGGVAVGVMIAMLLGTLVTVVALVLMLGLVIMRIFLAPVIAIDPTIGNIGVMDAFSMSWSLTRGRGLSLLAVLFIGGLLASLTILLFAVGYLLVGIPFFFALLGATHELVNRRATIAPRVA